MFLFVKIWFVLGCSSAAAETMVIQDLAKSKIDGSKFILATIDNIRKHHLDRERYPDVENLASISIAFVSQNCLVKVNNQRRVNLVGMETNPVIVTSLAPFLAQNEIIWGTADFPGTNVTTKQRYIKDAI